MYTCSCSCLSIYLSIYLSVCLSACLSIYLSICKLENEAILRDFLNSPHLCVGFLFLVVHSRLPPSPPPPPPPRPPPPPASASSHTTCSHTTCSHTTYSHTTCSHTTYSYTNCPPTHTHTTCSHPTCSHPTCSHPTCSHPTYSHTTCSHTTCLHTTCPPIHTHTTCSHTTCSHPTCSHPTCSHPTCSHTTCSHTTCPHTRLVHTQLAHTQLVSTQLSHTTYSHPTLAGLAAGVALVELGWLCWRSWVPGPLSPLLFVWQAWRLATSTFTLRGRRGTWRGDIDLHFAWQAWHLATSTCILRGRCTYATGQAGRALGSQLMPWTPRLFVWHVALGDVEVHSAWQAWRFATPMGILRGRRGTYGTGQALVARWGPGWRRGRRCCLCGRCLAASTFTLRGKHRTWRHRRAFCVASVALMALGWVWCRACGPLVARGAAALCVAGVALGDIHLRFAWQAWPLLTSTFVLPGKCSIWWHPRCKWVHLSQIRLAPHLCMGFLFLLLYPVRSSILPSLRSSRPHPIFHTQLCHTQLCHTPTWSHPTLSHTHTHHLSHTTLSHPTLSHTHTPSFTYNFVTHNFVTHNFVTHNLTLTTLSPSFTHNFVTHTIFHTQLCRTHHLSHTTLSHNFVTHNSSHTTFWIIDPPPSPLSFLLSPRCFSHFSWLLEEVDLWGCPVL